MIQRRRREGPSLRIRIMLWVNVMLVAGVALAALATTYQVDRILKSQWEDDAKAKMRLLTEMIVVGLQVPEVVEANLEEQMIAQARITAHLVRAAERAGMAPDEINAILSEIAADSVVDEFRIGNEAAELSLTNVDVDSTSNPDPLQPPLLDSFTPLLSQENGSIVEQVRLEDGQMFSYAAVSGVDRPGIVLVGQRAMLQSKLERVYGTNWIDELIGAAAVQYIRLVDTERNTLTTAGSEQASLEGSEALADTARAIEDAETTIRWKPKTLVVTAPLLDSDGETVLGAGVLQISTEHLERVRRNALIGGGLLGSLMLVVGMIVSYWVAGRIIHPLQTMASLALKVADRDLSRSIEVRHSAELGQLESALDQMTDNLRAAIQRIRESARHIGDSSAQIEGVVTELNQATNQQAAAVSETTAAMEELRAVTEQIAEGSQAVRDAAIQAQGDVQAGLRAVSETVTRMEEIRSSNEASVNEILALGDKARQISSVMDLIDDIAAQTKLIAINASIEAAAAGKAGQRFGVVASQVRHLAENVAQSTDEIRLRVREIQTAINELTIAAEQGTKKIDQGVALSRTTQQTLDQIAASAGNTSVAAQQITISTRQQQTAVGQVVEALQELSMEVNRVATGTNQTTEIVADLGHLAQALNELVALFDLGEHETQGGKRKQAGRET